MNLLDVLYNLDTNTNIILTLEYIKSNVHKYNNTTLIEIFNRMDKLYHRNNKIAEHWIEILSVIEIKEDIIKYLDIFFYSVDIKKYNITVLIIKYKSLLIKYGEYLNDRDLENVEIECKKVLIQNIKELLL